MARTTVAGRLPSFGILSYVGRKSGRFYRTPLNVFKRGDGYLFALTYGSEVDWVKNVLAAGEADLRTPDATSTSSSPRCSSTRPAISCAPGPNILRLNNVSEFLRMRQPPVR